MTLYLDAGVPATARKTDRKEWVDLCTAVCRLFLFFIFLIINIATVSQQTTGNLKTVSPGLCGDHYSGDEWRVLTQ